MNRANKAFHSLLLLSSLFLSLFLSRSCRQCELYTLPGRIVRGKNWKKKRHGEKKRLNLLQRWPKASYICIDGCIHRHLRNLTTSGNRKGKGIKAKAYVRTNHKKSRRSLKLVHLSLCFSFGLGFYSRQMLKWQKWMCAGNITLLSLARSSEQIYPTGLAGCTYSLA